MSLSDAAHLEECKLTRDAIVAAMKSGRRVGSYTIAGRVVTVEASKDNLEVIREEIKEYEQKVNNASGGNTFRVAKLNQPSRSG